MKVAKAPVTSLKKKLTKPDRHLRWLLYEAASTILTRVSAESSLRTWGLTSFEAA